MESVKSQRNCTKFYKDEYLYNAKSCRQKMKRNFDDVSEKDSARKRRHYCKDRQCTYP